MNSRAVAEIEVEGKTHHLDYYMLWAKHLSLGRAQHAHRYTASISKHKEEKLAKNNK